jgi:hypothetical protein
MFLAMAVGDGLGIMAFLKLRSLSMQSASAQAAAQPGATAKPNGKPSAKSAAKPAPKAPPKPTADNANFVEIPQFVVTVPAPAPKASGAAVADGSDAGAGDPAASAGRAGYLQLSLSFLTESQRAAKDFGKLMPMIKSAIISDVMSSGLSPNEDPVKMKLQISDYSLQAANTIVSQADSKVGKTPFVGAYVTTFVTQ